jgi:hypothetical protein
MPNPLASPADYEAFVYALPERYSSIERSSLVYIPLGTRVGKVTGMILFPGDIVLCVQEFLNFELEVIEGYGYYAVIPYFSSNHASKSSYPPFSDNSFAIACQVVRLRTAGPCKAAPTARNCSSTFPPGAKAGLLAS